MVEARSLVIETEAPRHPPTPARVRLEEGEHFFVGTTGSIGECPRHRVLEMEVSNRKGVGVAERVSRRHRDRPWSEAGDVCGSGCEEFRRRDVGEFSSHGEVCKLANRPRAASFDADSVEVNGRKVCKRCGIR